MKLPVANKRVLKAATALSFAMLGFGAFAPAQAHDKADASEDAEKAIVTSARLRNERSQQVPISLATVSSSALATDGAASLGDLQQFVPNLTVRNPNASNSILSASIRGIGGGDQLWGADKGVAFYVDDVYVADPQGAVLDLYNLDHIEVLRGSQNVLYGNNSIGGVVKYITKPLGHTASFGAKVTVGTYYNEPVAPVETRAAFPISSLALSGVLPLGSHLTLGAALSKRNGFGYGTNLDTGKHNNTLDTLASRLTAEWTISDAASWTLSYDRFSDKSLPRQGHREVSALNGMGALLYPATPSPVNARPGQPTAGIYDSYAGLNDRNRITTDAFSSVFAWKLGDNFTAKSISAYRKVKARTAFDVDSTPRDAFDVRAKSESQQLSQEFKLAYTGERWNSVAGVYYLDYKDEGASDRLLGSEDAKAAYAALYDSYLGYPYFSLLYGKFANGLTLLSKGTQHNQSLATYFDSSVKLTSKVSLEIGGRYTTDHKVGTVLLAHYYGRKSPEFGGTTFIAAPVVKTDYAYDRTFSAFTPHATLSYNLTGTLTAYVSASKGYKSGGNDYYADATLTASTVNGFKPESAINSELGLKGSVLDNRIRFAADLFSTKYKDIQADSLANGTTGFNTFVTNAASAHLKGAEFDANARVTSNLDLSVSAGYVKAAYDTFLVYNTTTNLFTDKSSTAKFPNTPKLTGSIGLNWHSSLAGGELAVAPLVSYRSATQAYEFAVPLLDQKAYWLYDLGASWTAPEGHYKIGVYGRNLTNKGIKVGGYNSPTGDFGNSVTSYYAQPSSLMLSLEYKY